MLPERAIREMPTEGPLVDCFGRVHTYLRLSVTDRCNFRCVYCMPLEGIDWTKRKDLLTYEEIGRVVRIFGAMGIRAIRLTGGEPTIRRDIDKLIAAIRAVPEIEDLAMTTNAHRLEGMAQKLADAGLDRINISIDTLDADVFAKLTRGGDLARVLRGVHAAREAGLTPIKINSVVVANENEDQAEGLIEYFSPHADDTEIRFIEYMPFSEPGRTHRPNAELRARLSERYDLQPASETVGRGPATSWRIGADGLRVGFISAMSGHFCESCNRLRLQCNGELRTCLSRDGTPSLREALRSGESDAALEQRIRGMVWGKVAGHEAHLGKPFEGTMVSVGG